jgi:dephospho-CoA kinase
MVLFRNTMTSRRGVFTLASLPDRWMHGAFPVLGLIGAIGGGKSQVATLLGKKGAIVIDADLVGHEVLEQPEIRRQVIERFGAGVLARGSDGTTPGPISRRALGAIVFSSRQALADLEAIVHPRMKQRFEAIIESAKLGSDAPAVVLDAAILLEAGWDKLCDLVVYVNAPEDLRVERVALERGWTAEALHSREAAQWPSDLKLGQADVVLCNDSSLEDLNRNVDRLFRLVTARKPFDPGVPKASGSSTLTSSTTGISTAVTLQPGDFG